MPSGAATTSHKLASKWHTREATQAKFYINDEQATQICWNCAPEDSSEVNSIVSETIEHGWKAKGIGANSWSREVVEEKCVANYRKSVSRICKHEFDKTRGVVSCIWWGYHRLLVALRLTSVLVKWGLEMHEWSEAFVYEITIPFTEQKGTYLLSRTNSRNKFRRQSVTM